MPGNPCATPSAPIHAGEVDTWLDVSVTISCDGVAARRFITVQNRKCKRQACDHFSFQPFCYATSLGLIRVRRLGNLILSTRILHNLLKARPPVNMATVQGVSGKQYVRGTAAYTTASWQYATSTHKIDHDMNPALVIQPKDKNDIKLALKYAKENNIAVAIRTGGHQYSGASSTGGRNIQLDLERTFQGPDDRMVFSKDGETLVRISVSWPLGAFNAWLTKRGT